MKLFFDRELEKYWSTQTLKIVFRIVTAGKCQLLKISLKKDEKISPSVSWQFALHAYVSILRVFLITSMLVFGCSHERKL